MVDEWARARGLKGCNIAMRRESREGETAPAVIPPTICQDRDARAPRVSKVESIFA